MDGPDQKYWAFEAELAVKVTRSPGHSTGLDEFIGGAAGIGVTVRVKETTESHPLTDCSVCE